MKKYARIAFLVVFATIIAVVAVKVITKPLEVEVYTTQPHKVEDYFIEEGNVKSNSQVQIFATVSGSMKSLNVSEGQIVSEGDVICVVDSTEYQFNISQAKANIDGYISQKKNLDLQEEKSRTELSSNRKLLQNEYNTLLAQEVDFKSQADKSNISVDEQIRLQNILIDQNTIELNSAQDNAYRAKLLYDVGAISKSEYDKANQLLSAAETALNANKQQLNVIQNGYNEISEDYYDSMKNSIQAKIESVDISMSNSYSSAMKEYYDSLIAVQNTAIELYNKKIDDCIIRTPVGGKISYLYAKDTNIVNSQSPIATLTTSQSSDIEVYISTKNFNAINIGDSVVLTQTQASEDMIFSGKIVAIENEAVTKISSLGIEEKKVKVTVQPETIDNVALFSGFSVDVKFVTYSAENQITVPKTAVFKSSDTDNDMVWVVENGKANIKEVVLGRELRTDYIVIDSLENDAIVIKNADNDSLKKGKNIQY